MMVVAYEALHCQEKSHDIPAQPPCIPGPPVFFSPVRIISPYKVPNCAVPSRFFTMYENRFDGGVLKLLSTRYHIYPERLYIDCSSCVGVANVMEVLPRLKQLSISFMELYEES